jgi:hypothetical protein
MQRTRPKADIGPDEAMINVKEAAAVLKLSEISIRRYLTQKKLKRYKAFGRTLLKESEVRALIKRA